VHPEPGSNSQKKFLRAMFGSNYFNKNSILRIEKGPFYFKFCILFNFQDPRISFDFLLTFVCASVKVLVKDIPQRLVCQELFSLFLKFFSKVAKPFI
ncbi:MAG: hypothetical protein IIY21_28580, partial [Clostridiales bacterium]|nr:hypothetical protein [Clostridiales bacterium]